MNNRLKLIIDSQEDMFTSKLVKEEFNEGSPYDTNFARKVLQIARDELLDSIAGMRNINEYIFFGEIEVEPELRNYLDEFGLNLESKLNSIKTALNKCWECNTERYWVTYRSGETRIDVCGHCGYEEEY